MQPSISRRHIIRHYCSTCSAGYNLRNWLSDCVWHMQKLWKWALKEFSNSYNYNTPYKTWHQLDNRKENPWIWTKKNWFLNSSLHASVGPWSLHHPWLPYPSLQFMLLMPRQHQKSVSFLPSVSEPFPRFALSSGFILLLKQAISQKSSLALTTSLHHRPHPKHHHFRTDRKEKFQTLTQTFERKRSCCLQWCMSRLHNCSIFFCGLLFLLEPLVLCFGHVS